MEYPQLFAVDLDLFIFLHFLLFLLKLSGDPLESTERPSHRREEDARFALELSFCRNIYTSNRWEVYKALGSQKRFFFQAGGLCALLDISW